MVTKQNILKILSISAVLAMISSNIQPSTGQAQSGDGLKRRMNIEGGRLSFISPESGKPLSAPQTPCNFIRPQDPAIALAKRFDPVFGLKNPERDLAELKNEQEENGRLTVGYQPTL